MRPVYVEYASCGDFLQDYLADLHSGGLFVHTTDAYEVGESLLITVVLPQIEDGVALAGHVIWRRAPARWRSALLPGIGVGFVEDHLNRAEFLLDFCNGELSALRKKGRRVPADFRVDILSGNNKISGRAKDISRGGLFVRTHTRFARDSQVDLALFFGEDESPEHFAGRVAWYKAAEPDPGIGIEFMFRTPVKRMQITNFVHQIEGRLSMPPPPPGRA